MSSQVRDWAATGRVYFLWCREAKNEFRTKVEDSMNRVFTKLAIAAALLTAPAYGQTQATRPPAASAPAPTVRFSRCFRRSSRDVPDQGSQKPRKLPSTGTGSGQPNMPMTKDGRRYWSITVGPLDPQLYGYWFMVDGVRTLDPSNIESERDSDHFISLVMISGPPMRCGISKTFRMAPSNRCGTPRRRCTWAAP